jgi:hypothetical protein
MTSELRVKSQYQVEKWFGRSLTSEELVEVASLEELSALRRSQDLTLSAGSRRA